MDVRVLVKGVDDKLIITIKESNWIDGNNSLRSYVNDNKKFLEKAKIVLDMKDIVINSNDLFDLRNFLNDNQIILTSILSTQEETITAAKLLGLSNNRNEKTKPNISHDPGSTLKPASIIQKTIRSGVVIENNVDIIIFGEVNPGAVIRTSGNIIVWGKLLGEVHAGIAGDQSAFIGALEMKPSLLTIAEVQFEGNKRKCNEPEIAFLKKDSIHIESWKKSSY